MGFFYWKKFRIFVAVKKIMLILVLGAMVALSACGNSESTTIETKDSAVSKIDSAWPTFIKGTDTSTVKTTGDSSVKN